MKDYEFRDYIYLGIFGTLWGVVEAFAGFLLHSLKVPLTGALLVGFGLIIALLGKYFVPKKFSIIYIGVIVSFIKITISGFHILIVIAIMVEVTIMEVCISVLGLNIIGNVTAGALCVAYTMVHKMAYLIAFVGKSIVEAYIEFGKKILKFLFDIQNPTDLEIIGLAIIPRIVIGIIAGLLATAIINAMKHRVVVHKQGFDK